MNAPLAAALVLALTLAACPATAPRPVPEDDGPRSPLLSFVNDESVLEERIASFLEERGLRVSRAGDANDLWLVLLWEGGAQPDFRITIDSFVSSRGADGPQERAILIRLETGLFASPQELVTLLSKLNAHHATNWAGTWYVDREDGQIEATWALNIPREVGSIEAGLVHDAVARLVVSWRELSEKLSEKLPNDVL